VSEEHVRDNCSQFPRPENIGIEKSCNLFWCQPLTKKDILSRLCRGDVAVAVEDEIYSIALQVYAERARWNDGKTCLLAKFPSYTVDDGLTIFEVTTREVSLPVDTGIGFAYKQYSAIWITGDNTGCNSIFSWFCHFSSGELLILPKIPMRSLLRFSIVQWSSP